MLGAAGFPSDHFERLVAANTRCAPLVATGASLGTRKQLVRRIDDLVDHDQRFAPLAPIAHDAGWTTIVASPFNFWHGVGGALSACYAEEPRPSVKNLALVSAVADYVGIAVSTAQKVAELKRVASDSERNRLRRDLHDSISSLLFSLRVRAIDLQVMQARAAEVDRAAMAASIDDMHILLESLAREIRSIVSEHHPVADLERESLFEAITALAEGFSRRTTADVALALPSISPQLTPDASSHIIHFLQEAIGNSISHAEPTKINVLLRVDSCSNALAIDVIDDGVGFDTFEHPLGGDEMGGYGLLSMAERAEIVGGRLNIRSRPGSGTAVTATIPLPSVAADQRR